MTDTTLTTIGITGQVVPLLCILSIPVLNWMERRKEKREIESQEDWDMEYEVDFENH